MAEPQTATPMPVPATAAEPSPNESANALLSQVYAELAGDGEPAPEPAPAPAPKAESEPKTESAPEPVSVPAPEPELSAERKALAADRTKMIQQYREQRSRESQWKEEYAKQRALLDSDRAAFELHKAEVHATKTEVDAALRDLRELERTDTDGQIKILQKLLGHRDIVELYQRMSAAAAGAPQRDPELLSELKALRESQAELAKKHEQELEKVRLAQQQREQDAANERAVAEGNARVERELASYAQSHPELVALTKLLPHGAAQTVQVMKSIGDQMVAAGERLTMSTAARRIAAETVHFLTTPKGREYLAGLRPATSIAAQSNSGTRTATPGASPTAADSSVPGTRRTDAPGTWEDQKKAWNAIPAEDFVNSMFGAGVLG